MFFRKRKQPLAKDSPKPRLRTQHIVIIDGTLSQLEDGKETHCGRIFKLIHNDNIRETRVFYDPGVQGEGFGKWFNVITGKGVNESVIRAFLDLSEHYHSGDEVYLFGYSRGAYAVRLLSGLIDDMGLLKRNFATSQFAKQAFNLFAERRKSEAFQNFQNHYSRPDIPVDFIGVFDTVKALGVPIPLLNRFSPLVVDFKDHQVPRCVKSAYQALAFHENRKAYHPEFWKSKSPHTILKQKVFPGTHAIIGGQIHDIPTAYKVSNLSINWILKNAEKAGLMLPPIWKKLYPTADDYSHHNHIRHFLWHRETRDFKPPELFHYHSGC